MILINYQNKKVTLNQGQVFPSLVEGLCANNVIKLSELPEIQSDMDDRMVLIVYILKYSVFRQRTNGEEKWQPIYL